MNWKPQIFENPEENKPIPPPLSPKKKFKILFINSSNNC